MIKHRDVLVVGGGMAGCTAALSAAREGASVLLLEQHDCLGGNATRAMVSPWQSFHACVMRDNAKLPRQVIGGIADELVFDLIHLGASLGHLVDPIGFAGSITPVDSEVLKLYLPAKLHDDGVEVRLGTPLTQEHLDSVRQIVDASGSAVAARMLGAPVLDPEDPQPLSWLFTMEGVDIEAIRRCQLEAGLDDFVLHPAFEQLCERSTHIAVSGFFKLVAGAQETGELSIPRDRLLFFSTPRPGEVLVNTTRIPANHPSPSAEGLRQVRELAAWLPIRVPGFSHAQLGRLACAPGRRESARLKGRTVLTTEDVVTGAASSEAIARGCYPVDIHQASSAGLSSSSVGGEGWYDIPLGCLESRAVPQLLCCGRCLSADRGGFASARVLPTAMATGHAAGLIAAHRALEREFELSACLSRISLV